MRILLFRNLGLLYLGPLFLQWSFELLWWLHAVLAVLLPATSAPPAEGKHVLQKELPSWCLARALGISGAHSCFSSAHSNLNQSRRRGTVSLLPGHVARIVASFLAFVLCVEKAKLKAIGIVAHPA